MRLKRVIASGLAVVMALSLDVPGVNAESKLIDTTLYSSTKEEQLDMVKNQKKLPGTNRTFFDENSDVRDWFNISGFAAEGVQDRSEYYEEYVANGCKNTKNYVVVEEDGYWDKDKNYITPAEYEALGETEKANYRFVTAEEQFTTAFGSFPKVIQVNALELELGFHYLQDNNIPAGPISPVTDYNSNSKIHPPITNPVIMHKDDVGAVDKTLTGTGVSDLNLYSHMTLFSTTGCMIRHAGIDVGGCEDVIIRNFQFEGMYEWDDATNNTGYVDGYTTRKRYGWCYVSGNDSDDIWVDHCTFGYAFDGNIDIKNGSSISITWCKFGVQDISTNGEPATTKWYESQGSELWKNILYMEEIYQNYKAGNVEENDKYAFYTKYRDQGATPQEILRYAAMHSKVHLCGSGESSFYTNVDEKISLGFNFYTSVIQRIPMIRQGNGHMYNCIVDNTDFTTQTEAMKKRGISLGYSSFISVNNARDGASIGSDTCIFKEVEPCTGKEYQGMEDQSGSIGDEWQNIIAPMVNHNVVVNSRVIKSDGTDYTGSSWDNNGENPFTKSRWEWQDKKSIGDFKWSKWKNQDELATYSGISQQLEGDKNKLFKYVEDRDWGAYYRDFYEGSDELGYDYQCFDLDQVEEKVMTYGGAMANLFGEDSTALDYVQPYNSASLSKNYEKKVVINTNGGVVEGKNDNVYLLKKGESVTLPTSAEMTKAGYDFIGWKKGSYVDGKLVLGDFLAKPEEAVTVTAPESGYEEETYYAFWDVKAFKVTLNSMGANEGNFVIRAQNNQTITQAGGFPANPTKTDATFLGWYNYNEETGTFGSKVLASAKVTSDMTLYAKWKNVIHFNTDGAAAIADKKVDSGKKITSLATPAKEGYDFVGWYTDAEFTKPFDVANDVVMEPMTLYAKFKSQQPETVTVSFITGYDGVVVAPMEVEVGSTGSAIAEMEAPKATEEMGNMTFAGWYYDAEFTNAFDPTAAISENLNLYAKWETVGKLGDADGDGEITANDALVILKYLVDMETGDFNETNADCDGNLGISSNDALVILKYLVGSIDTI